MEEKKQQLFEIDFTKLLFALLEKWLLIVICAIFIASIALGATYYYVTPKYQATATIYVNNTVAGRQTDYVSSGDLSTSQQLITTYITIAKSDRVMREVAEELNGDYSVGQLQGMFSANKVGDTEVFAVNITSTSPEESARIANAMAEVLPKELASLIDGSSAWVLDYAKVPTERSSPSYRKSALIGGALGGGIAAAYVAIQFLLDVRIKTEEDLAAYHLPVLGQVPNFALHTHPSVGYGAGNKESDSSGNRVNREKGERK